MNTTGGGLSQESRKILLVDDDEHSRQFTAAVLERNGFEVLQAGDASESFEIWNEERASIDLLLVDVVLPGVRGLDIAQRLAGEKSDLKVIFISAYADEEFIHNSAVPEGSTFLPKPFAPTKLVEWVRKQF